MHPSTEITDTSKCSFSQSCLVNFYWPENILFSEAAKTDVLCLITAHQSHFLALNNILFRTIYKVTAFSTISTLTEEI